MLDGCKVGDSRVALGYLQALGEKRAMSGGNMSELNATREGFWQTRYSIIAMCFAATFGCYIDRVNIYVTIIPMADDYG